MAAKIWYKHIKVGDVILVKFLPKSNWGQCGYLGEHEVTVTHTFGNGKIIAGEWNCPIAKGTTHIHISYEEESSPSSKYNIIRKIKKVS